MCINKLKKNSNCATSKGVGKTQAFSAGIARMQKTGYKFVVIDSKEFEKEVKSLLV